MNEGNKLIIEKNQELKELFSSNLKSEEKKKQLAEGMQEIRQIRNALGNVGIIKGRENISLAGATIHDQDFSDLDLHNVDFTGATFTGNINLNKADLTGARLVNVDFTGATFTGNINFNNADLRGANLTKVDCTNATFENTALKRIKLDGAKLPDNMFSHPKHRFTGVELTPEILKGKECYKNDQHANFQGAIFKGDFSQVTGNRLFTENLVPLTGMNLKDATLPRLYLTGKNLENSTLENTVPRNNNLENKNLENTILGPKTLENQRIKDINYNGAILSGDFSNMNLSGVNLAGVKLENVTFGKEGIGEEELKKIPDILKIRVIDNNKTGNANDIRGLKPEILGKAKLDVIEDQRKQGGSTGKVYTDFIDNNAVSSNKDNPKFKDGFAKIESNASTIEQHLNAFKEKVNADPNAVAHGSTMLQKVSEFNNKAMEHMQKAAESKGFFERRRELKKANLNSELAEKYIEKSGLKQIEAPKVETGNIANLFDSKNAPNTTKINTLADSNNKMLKNSDYVSALAVIRQTERDLNKVYDSYKDKDIPDDVQKYLVEAKQKNAEALEKLGDSGKKFFNGGIIKEAKELAKDAKQWAGQASGPSDAPLVEQKLNVFERFANWCKGKPSTPEVAKEEKNVRDLFQGNRLLSMAGNAVGENNTIPEVNLENVVKSVLAEGERPDHLLEKVAILQVAGDLAIEDRKEDKPKYDGQDRRSPTMQQFREKMQQEKERLPEDQWNKKVEETRAFFKDTVQRLQEKNVSSVKSVGNEGKVADTGKNAQLKGNVEISM